MIEILRGFFQLVIWAFVPAMASIVLSKMYMFSQIAETKEYRAAARAGFWGGLILFLIVFVAQVGRYVQTSFPQEPIYQGFNPFLTLGAAAVMFGALYGRRAVRAKLLGWLVLAITALSLWSLFHYLFIHTANESILSLALGIALGLFGHTALPLRVHKDG